MFDGWSRIGNWDAHQSSWDQKRRCYGTEAPQWTGAEKQTGLVGRLRSWNSKNDENNRYKHVSKQHLGYYCCRIIQKIQMCHQTLSLILNINQSWFLEDPVLEPCLNIPALFSVVYQIQVGCKDSQPVFPAQLDRELGLHSWCFSGSGFLIRLDPTFSPISLYFFPCPSIHLSHYLFDLFLGHIPILFLVELNYFLSVNPHWPHPYGQSPCSSLADPFPFLRVLASWISNLAGSLAPFGLFKAGLMRNFPLGNWKLAGGQWLEHIATMTSYHIDQIDRKIEKLKFAFYIPI